MAKGVVFGVIGCVTVLPAFILVFDKPLQFNIIIMPIEARNTNGTSHPSNSTSIATVANSTASPT